MKLGLLFASLLAVSAGAQPVFKSEVTMVKLLVNVKDAKGNVVGALDAKDFSIFDLGVKQEIAAFDRETAVPLSIALLVDVSGSTTKDLTYEKNSAEKFFRALLGQGNPKDAAALYSFNQDVTEVRGFTRRVSQLSNALRTLRGDAGTSLYDAIRLASESLSNRDGRHVIVLVTDGGDTTSKSRYADALEAAHLADAVVYPILVVPVTNNAGRNTGGENALTQIARDTGGRVFEPVEGAQADQSFTDRAFADILHDLRTQYVIGYYPHGLPKDAPRFHLVKVAMTRPDLRPQTRTGYYSEKSR